MDDFWDELDEQWQKEARQKAQEEAGKSNDYELLPEGTYNVKVEDWTIMRSKKKETPGLNMEFVVVDGDHKKRKIWHTFWLTPNNLPFVGRDLNFLTGKLFTKFSELKTYDFKDLYVKVKLKHEEYEGKVSAKVAYFSVLSGSQSSPQPVASHEDDPF